ncbi:Putative E3 ubiquitin-protein ligase LIN-1 [Apostasia shenzhenica]|uniref:RING-type E3 ubiquitin transferase n=1 Tax=Apostasia shenzhenica TaxID=1088818 RepID=A0A2I0BBH3_9ASPA|nr:Putative E3 ubiquitin-protein ligase LIN-1 [Apostasia shenzhenica]
MATLEELLAEDGFKRSRQKPNLGPRRRRIFPSRNSSLPNPRLRSYGSRIETERTISDTFRRKLPPMMPETDELTERSPSNTLRTKLSYVDRVGERSPDVQEPGGRSLNFFMKCESGGSSGKNHWDVFPVEETDADRYSGKIQEKAGYNKIFKSKSYEYAQKKEKKTPNLPVKNLSLKENFRDEYPLHSVNEASVKTVTSILNSFVKRILKDENFRSFMYQRCTFSLKSNGVKDIGHNNCVVLSTLKEAIAAVHRIISEGVNELELNKASLNLSMITGLKLMNLDVGYTSGIPNSHLAACAHLYLSIICMIQKKDKVSAKYLLQVFCDTPHHSRRKLLPEIWERLFWLHLTHLKEWYDKEVESVQGTSGVTMKMELLEKVFNDLLDVSTCQLASYYQDLLMDETDSPALPSVSIPFASFGEVSGDANAVSSAKVSTTILIPTTPMISKMLCESVFSPSSRSRTNEVENEESEDETEGGHLVVWKGRDYKSVLKNRQMRSQSSNFCTFMADDLQDHVKFLEDSDSFSDVMEESFHTAETSSCSSSSGILMVDDLLDGSEVVQSSPEINYDDFPDYDHTEVENDLNMRKLAQGAFHLHEIDHPNGEKTFTPKHTINSAVYGEKMQLKEQEYSEFFWDEPDRAPRRSGSNSSKKNSSDELFVYHEDIEQGSVISTIPKDFFCPLTGLLLKDPVTLETGYTFERMAIKKRFDQGNGICPVSGQELRYSAVPETNIVLKHMISEWIAEWLRNFLTFFSQNMPITLKEDGRSTFETALFLMEQILAGLGAMEEKENIKHLISLGGLHFLIQMMGLRSLEVQLRAAKLLVRFIWADGRCRNYLAMHIRKLSLLELIHSKQVGAKNNVVSLLIELICLNRRMEVNSFLSGLIVEVTVSMMDELLVCLRCSQPEERVLVSVLLLHFVVMEESHITSAYGKEALKCIIEALECCLLDKKFIANCQRALLMLGGRFSSSGEIMTETWLLKQAEYNGIVLSYIDEDDQTISEEERREREVWLERMALVLLRVGKKQFLVALSNCWNSGIPDLVKMSLVTTVWLSHALTSLSAIAVQFSSILTLLPRLKESLKRDPDIKNRVLASLCLLNFSKIYEFRIPLISLADEIYEPLKRLAGLTWTAKHLLKDIFVENT